MSTPRIFPVETATDLVRCFPVMRELRPHLRDADEFAARVARQEAQGFRLAALEDDGEVRAVTGYRFGENLSSGKYLYVDDLVTLPGERSRGHGGRLFDWLMARAREAGCVELHLDSGVQRFDAHRFYLLKRMEIRCHNFRIAL